MGRIPTPRINPPLFSKIQDQTITVPVKVTVPQFATISTRVDPVVGTVGDCTSMPDVVALSRASSVPGVPLLRVNSVLKQSAWVKLMARHPDRKYAATMLNYVANGAPIFYSGPESERVCPNWKSTVEFKEDVQKCIDRDVSLGRKSGPFSYPPLMNFVSSSLGAFVAICRGRHLVVLTPI